MYILRSSKISFIVNMEIDYILSYRPNYWYYAHSLHTLLTQIKLTTISSVVMFASPNVFSSAVYLHQILFIKQLILQCSVIDTLTTTDAFYTQTQKRAFSFSWWGRVSGWKLQCGTNSRVNIHTIKPLHLSIKTFITMVWLMCSRYSNFESSCT